MRTCYYCLNVIQGTILNDLVFIGMAAQKIVKQSGNVRIKKLAAEQFQRVLKIETYFSEKIEKEKQKC